MVRNKTMRDVQPPCAPIVLDWELRTGQGREGPSRLRFFKDPEETIKVVSCPLR